MVEIRRLSATTDRELVRQLAQLLIDCVDGGASVSFMAGLTSAEAETFFKKVLRSVQEEGRILLGAFSGSELVGSVQLVTQMPPNQLHRGEVAKLLVRRSERGHGVGNQLMVALESAARDAGKTLLTLDTYTGSDAERLYGRLGWSKSGVIPDYALMPDGTLSGTTIFWKKLKRSLR